MRRPATKEVRELIVYQTERLGWTTDQVATALNVTSRTVQRVRKLNREIGDVTMEPSIIGKAKILSSLSQL
jgi:transposase